MTEEEELERCIDYNQERRKYKKNVQKQYKVKKNYQGNSQVM